MQSVFSVVCVALFAQKIFSLPTLPSSDDAGLSADLGLDPNQLSTVGTDPGPSFSSLDAPPSDNPEASLSQQLALVDPGCNKTPKAKRETGVVGTTCPADFTNSSPKKTPEGQQQNSVPQRPTNATPKKPGRKGDLRLTPSEEPFRNQYGSEEQDSKCPLQYKYTVCGIADLRYDTWGTLFTLSEADLVINYGFGHGMIVHPDWANRGGIAGWTDALQECGPEPKDIYCCNVYLPQARQAYICDTTDHAQRVARCLEGVSAMPSQRVISCLEIP